MRSSNSKNGLQNSITETIFQNYISFLVKPKK